MTYIDFASHLAARHLAAAKGLPLYRAVSDAIITIHNDGGTLSGDTIQAALHAAYAAATLLGYPHANIEACSILDHAESNGLL